MPDNHSPIGIFDSGVGGLSVMTVLSTLLPNEDMYYYCDNRHAPYGPQPVSSIIGFAETITDFLLKKGCKCIVVACNTATAAAINHLRGQYNVPFVGIEPAIKPAALHSATKKVGVLATQGTLHGGHFINTAEKYANGVDLIVREGDGLVEIVENGLTGTPESISLLKRYIQPMLNENIDQLVLGCTHYPFLIHDIKSFIPEKIKIINPAPAVAAQVKRVLEKHKLLNNPDNVPAYHFFSSGPGDRLKSLAGSVISTANMGFYPA